MNGKTWLAPLVLVVTLLGVYVPTAADGYANPDAYSSSLASWRIATTGEPWMEAVDFDELRGISDTRTWQSEAPNGHIVPQRMYGPILLAVPFYAVNPYAEEREFSVYRGGIAAATSVAFAMMFLFLAMRRQVGDARAAIGTVILALATPVWSVGADALWPHCVTLLGLAATAWATARGKWVVAGIALGVGLWGRPHLAVCAAVIGLGLAWSRSSPRIALAIGGPTALGLAGLATWNHYVFGVWHPLGAYTTRSFKASVPETPYGDGSASQFENVLGFLISPDRGLFVWTPLLLVLLPAVVRSWRHLPDWSRWLLIAAVSYSALQLGLNTFLGGDGFYGYRLALELLVGAAPVYVLSWSSAGAFARHVAPILGGLQLAAITLGAVTEGFLLNYSMAWTDNSYLYAWRTYPVFLIVYSMAFVAAAVLVARLIAGSRAAVGGPPDNFDRAPSVGEPYADRR